MDEQQSLLVKLLRGLDNGMPQGMRPMWERMTPDFQKQKAQELQMQQQQEQMLRQGGVDPEMAEMKAEYDQYRRARR